ncbi:MULTISPECIES: hypothetical protein [unclassified Thiocapsa]|uniref:hypothetical protein n=1 Tax=unclassified Thiocapsa TaxID=2641286 RepID=UPI0035B2B249
MAYYTDYTAYVVMAAMQHAALDLYGTAMLWFILPLTGITLAVMFARDHVNGRDKTNGG